MSHPQFLRQFNLVPVVNHLSTLLLLGDRPLFLSHVLWGKSKDELVTVHVAGTWYFNSLKGTQTPMFKRPACCPGNILFCKFLICKKKKAYIHVRDYKRQFFHFSSAIADGKRENSYLGKGVHIFSA